MPLYELFCLARPALAQAHKSEILKAAATSILGSGGVLTDLKNFGERRLAYPIRRQGTKLEEAFMWQLTFMASPSAIPDLEHGLKVDERVLRHILVKKEPFKAKPNTYKVSKMATRLLAASSATGAPRSD